MKMKECPICGREIYEIAMEPYNICIVCRTVGPDPPHYIPVKGKLKTIFHKERIPIIPVEDMMKLYDEYYEQRKREISELDKDIEDAKSRIKEARSNYGCDLKDLT